MPSTKAGYAMRKGYGGSAQSANKYENAPKQSGAVKARSGAGKKLPGASKQ